MCFVKKLNCWICQFIVKEMLLLKIDKRILVPVVIAIIVVAVWVSFFWYPGYVLDQKVEELKADGVEIKVIDYTRYYEDATTINPTAVFAQQVDWSAFKQEVMAVKANQGSVFVSVDSGQRILLLDLDETTHYYYQV
jgi:hypothetical protein